MNKILLTLLVSFSMSAMAGSTLLRNTTNYYLNHYAFQAVYTNPIQANQPVYSWRTHTRFDGTPGIHSQNGELIGYTDSQGVFISVVPRLPFDPVHCGWINQERVAVGSPYARKSNAISYTIKAGRVGPLPPWYNECVPQSINNEK
ncbi:MAG: hypothetical protein HWE27_18530 [Gammaproteobacteria bacterium]|nr:hypothetical protein [Gammaproteobacteria bacterium]